MAKFRQAGRSLGFAKNDEKQKGQAPLGRLNLRGFARRRCRRVDLDAYRQAGKSI
jgi:hypothetical protein